MPYNIRIMSTYPPRKCGVGTFSRDLAGALENFTGEVNHIRVAAIDKDKLPYNIPVDLIVHQYNPESWHKAGSMDLIRIKMASTQEAQILLLWQKHSVSRDL